MTVFTYSQARQNFSAVLDRAKKEGRVLIKRKDGSVFTLCPEKPQSSPLDVKGVKTKVSTGEIVRAVRQSRRRRA
jgi:antitoxin (DNA-binding transcriptional repressor) of toxin-antitoxin stability system